MLTTSALEFAGLLHAYAGPFVGYNAGLQRKVAHMLMTPFSGRYADLDEQPYQFFGKAV